MTLLANARGISPKFLCQKPRRYSAGRASQARFSPARRCADESRLCGDHSQPHVVEPPLTIVKQGTVAAFGCLNTKLGPAGTEVVHQVRLKHRKPGGQAVLAGYRRRTFEVTQFTHDQAALFEQPGIAAWTWKEPAEVRRGIDAPLAQDVTDGADHRPHATCSAEFGYEAPSRKQRALDPAEYVRGARHPVERRVGEHCVELWGVAQRLAISDFEGEIAIFFARAFDHRWRVIDADDARSLAGD